MLKPTARGVALSATLLACSHAPIAPVHEQVVCPLGADGAAACDVARLTGVFERWSVAALGRPGSTFGVWVAGTDRMSAKRFISACVPDSGWGNNVVGAKSDFLKAVKEALTRPTSGAEAVFPTGCLPANADGSTPLVQLDPGGSLARRFADLSDAAPVAAQHTAVVCDASDSTLGRACDGRGLEQAFDRWLLQSKAQPGSAFVVYVPGRERDQTSTVFSYRPAAGSPGERYAVALGARAELARVLPTRGPGSAIAEGVSVAASELPAAPIRRDLVLLSDLRQFTRGRWNFERSVPSPTSFVASLRQDHLLPRLDGVAVLVCGVHQQRGPAAAGFDVRLAEGIRNAWSAAFSAMNVRAVEIHADCTEALEPQSTTTTASATAAR